MPSFDLSSGDITILAMALVLVVMPSMVPRLGNLLGRVFAGKKQ
jgi:hypothetical protein